MLSTQTNRMADFAFGSMWWVADGLIGKKWKFDLPFVQQRKGHPGLCTNSYAGAASVMLLFGSSYGPGWAYRVTGLSAETRSKETRFVDALKPLIYAEAVDGSKVWRNMTLPNLPQDKHEELRLWLYRQRPKLPPP